MDDKVAPIMLPVITDSAKRTPSRGYSADIVSSALSWNEFHVSRKIREKCLFDELLFASTGNVIIAEFKNAQIFAQKINRYIDTQPVDTQIDAAQRGKAIRAGQLNTMGIIDEVFHFCCGLFRKQANPEAFNETLAVLEQQAGKDAVDRLLTEFTEEFPPLAVYKKQQTIQEYLSGAAIDGATGQMRSNRAAALEEFILLRLANENPAFAPFGILFNDSKLAENPFYDTSWDIIGKYFKTQPTIGPHQNDLITMLREPVVFSPNSLRGQLDYIRKYWLTFLGDWLKRILLTLDVLAEEEKAGWNPNFGDLPPMAVYTFDREAKEYERFSTDREWMPKVVLLAKSTFVWLAQLSRKYGWAITRLDHIPDEELDAIASQGFTGLWLIGLWSRSHASSTIKQRCGNPEAAASAYSLYDYDIAENFGGWDALDNLRRRLWQRGVRIAADMVPNHTGIDSKWVAERPELFMQTRDCPFPTYTFNGENLSWDSRVGIYLEDHYYSKTDCAVVCKRVDNTTGDTRYLYHGNDGTGLPWNDTAQIDFLNPAAREEVIQQILRVARNFPIIRFDAAMVLAKKHIRRLWYPAPGQGGDIASRAWHAMSQDEFDRCIPEEFWREVVDRCAREVPDTLLLAEAFWMMEGFFVRTLGMHRVYNSAFMNMLKKEENQKYRATIKNTIEFDPQVLKRFVNFMNNPDEDTAVAQFGTGDKYFGICTMMVTMPGLPMFGHGQIEGYTEKYGMEYTHDYFHETPNIDLLERHKREIFPLMKQRYLFAEIENFLLYDVWMNSQVNENVFAYSNSTGYETAVVFYNNCYERTSGWINRSAPFAVKVNPNDENNNEIRQETRTIADALGLSGDEKEFCIFREQRSNLWFIRESKSICENGIFVALNGFECQIFTDISRVTDDVTGKYKILCDALAGSGVPDFESALYETFLHDLYRAFEAFATPSFFADIKTICLPPAKKPLSKKVPKEKTAKEKVAAVKMPEQIFAAAYPAWLAFYKALDEFIAGNYGAAAVIDLKIRGTKIPAKTAWQQFTTRMTRFLEIMPVALRTEFADIPAPIEIISGYTMLFSLSEAIGKKAAVRDVYALIKDWRLDKKLASMLDKAEIAVRYEIITPIIMVRESLPLCDLFAARQAAQKADSGAKKATATITETAHIIVKTLFDSDAAPIVLGANEFNTQWWFNKELSDKMFQIALFAPLLFAPQQPEGTDDRAFYDAVLDKIIAARNASDYKVDVFIEKFTKKAISAKKLPVKKSSAQKSPVKTKTGKPKKQ